MASAASRYFLAHQDSAPTALLTPAVCLGYVREVLMLVVLHNMEVCILCASYVHLMCISVTIRAYSCGRECNHAPIRSIIYESKSTNKMFLRLLIDGNLSVYLVSKDC